MCVYCLQQLDVQRSPEWRRLVDAVVAEERGGNGTQEVHPKLVKLKEVLVEHFDRHNAGGSSTRAIVFTQYRHSVEEVSIGSVYFSAAACLLMHTFIDSAGSVFTNVYTAVCGAACFSQQ